MNFHENKSTARKSVRGKCQKNATRLKVVCPECGVLMHRENDDPARINSSDYCAKNLRETNADRDQPPAPEKAATKMRAVNCTPHVICLIDENGNSTSFPPSGIVPRVAVTQEPVEGPLPMVRTIYGEIEGLPDPEPDTLYIVSNVVLTALAGSRPDVIAPDTGPLSAVRDEAGQIIGVRNFRV